MVPPLLLAGYHTGSNRGDTGRFRGNKSCKLAPKSPTAEKPQIILPSEHKIRIPNDMYLLGHEHLVDAADADDCDALLLAQHGHAHKQYRT